MNTGGIGHISLPRDWGKIPKCPYCEKTDIVRVSKSQIICGATLCKNKLHRVSEKKSRRKLQRKLQIRRARA